MSRNAHRFLRGWPGSLRVFPALVALVVLGAGALFAQDAPRTGSPDEMLRILEVVNPIGTFRPCPSLNSGGYTIALLDDRGTRLGSLSLERTDHSGAEITRLRSRHFAVVISNYTPDPTVTERLVRAAHAVVNWDGGALPERPEHLRAQPIEGFFLPTGILVGLALATGWARRGKIQTDLRAVHVVQMLTQGSIFVYWSLYWPGVGPQVPIIGLMLVMGFAADAMFSFARFGSWRAGFSVVPVVFSINLFEWFDVRGAVLSVVAAFACKHFVHRGGRHIFNPSVAGLTITGIVTILAPNAIHFGGLFHTLNVPPNMTEWILLVTLIPILRFRILPVSIGTLMALTWWHIPGVLRPTIVIAMTLLATDPATSPTTDLGKFLFGMVFGGLLPVFSIALRGHGDPDDFAKILAIPVANLLVPQLDAVATRMTARIVEVRDLAWARVSQAAHLGASTLDRLGGYVRRPIPNMVFVACWLASIVPRLEVEKPLYFEPEIHWNYATPLVVRGADDIPHCNDNPVFCQVFSFRGEAALWWRHRRSGH